MKQVQIIQGAISSQVNQWLKENADKNIIDIKHSVGGQNNVVVMIIYENNA